MNNRWRQMFRAAGKKHEDFKIPTKFYIQKGNKFILSKNCYQTEIYLRYGNRIIGRTRISKGVGVSTVFLSLDHSWHFNGSKPILYETMVFGGESDGCMWRYHTKKEATKGHNEIVNILREKKRVANN